MVCVAEMNKVVFHCVASWYEFNVDMFNEIY